MTRVTVDRDLAYVRVTALPAPRLYVVTEPEDDPARAEFIADLHDPARGRVGVEMRPGTRNATWVGRAIGEKLGQNMSSSSSSRNENLIWRRITDWLAGEQTRDLFIDRAHLIGSGLWRDLVELAATNNCTLWLITRHPALPRTSSDLVRDWAFTALDWQQFEERWRERHDRSANAASDGSDARSPTEQEQLLPVVPEDDFLTFIATAERALEQAEFGHVDALYERERLAALAWLDRQETNELAWFPFVRELIGRGSALPDALVRLRGCQAAFFLRGLWLKCDLRLLRLGFDSGASQELTPEITDRLRTQTNPLWAALATVRLTTGAGVAELQDATVADAAEDGRTVRRGGVVYSVPRYAQGILCAYLQERARDGASPDEALFVTRRSYGGTPEPIDARGAQRALRKLGLDIGVELVWRKESYTSDDRAWLKKHGIRLAVLDEARWNV